MEISGFRATGAVIIHITSGGFLDTVELMDGFQAVGDNVFE